MSTSQRRATSPPNRRSLQTCVIATASLAILAALSGCGPPADQALEHDRPAQASIVGRLPSEDLERDSTPMVLRRVWGGVDVDLLGASVSADGRYLTYIAWTSTGDVWVRELATGDVERVTYDGVWHPYQTAEQASISPDGRQVAYLWYREDVSTYNNYELRVIRRGERKPVLLYGSEDCDYPDPMGWSPEGDKVLFLAYMKDGTRRLMAVSVADGSLETLKDLGSADVDPGALSPDGELLTYSAPEDEDADARDIFVLDLRSGRTTPLIRNPADDYVLGWSPDGAYILFASDRSGTLGAWLQPMKDGRPSGDPWMVKADLWQAVPIGFTRDGRYFFGISLGSRKIQIASVDPRTGAVLAPPTPVSGDRLAHEDFPSWSPDGRYLAYRSIMDVWGSKPGGKPKIVIRSVETGDSRDLVPDLEGFGNFRWYPDGRHLLVDGRKGEEQGGLWRVDIETGAAEVAEGLEGVTVTRLVDWGPRGRKLFYRARRPAPTAGGADSTWTPGSHPTVFDLDTGTETVLYDGAIGYFPGLSPDGRQLAFAADYAGTPALMMASTAGGKPRVLVRFEGPDSIRGREFIRGIAWSIDGRTLLFARVGDEQGGLWRVPAAGGVPRRIELGLNGSHPGSGFRSLRMNPDGHHIAFDVGEGNGEIWVMEDFLPGRSGKNMRN
ncbi:MAG: hypothetical protein LJF04_03790 [Gemmatimonadetes bacterium]|nr:hypothetical protein [Gemmatimonadota bacterium]